MVYWCCNRKLPSKGEANHMARHFYTCQEPDCGFVFERYGDVAACPRCGKRNLRPATPEEQQKCVEQLKQIHGKL